MQPAHFEKMMSDIAKYLPGKILGKIAPHMCLCVFFEGNQKGNHNLFGGVPHSYLGMAYFRVVN